MPNAARWLPLVLGLAGCSAIPAGAPPGPSHAFKDTASTRLGRALAARLGDAPQSSAFAFLAEGLDAFATRAALSDMAERSIDAQYYMWHADVTGRLLMSRVWAAAERGVRVRLLIDDIHTEGEDRALAALDAHPNVEVRLFNPFSRPGRWLDYLTDFRRVNHRMHNKSFTVDNQATVVGGRNVGDEYFHADAALDFADLDVLAAGPVVGQVSAAFDRYWNSRAARPIGELVAPATPEEVAAQAAALRSLSGEPAATRYREALRQARLPERMASGELRFFHGKALLLCDDPEKVFERDPGDSLLLLPALLQAMQPVARELVLVSAYFVPGRTGSDDLRKLASQGVHVRVLTNSLAATDVVAAHAGYARYREALLRSGVELHELEPAEGAAAARAAKQDGIGGSSRASLHAKTMVADRQRLFVGSFNLDPRSARLNTEMGVVFDSPAAAEALAKGIENVAAERAYEVKLATPPAGGRLVWVEPAARKQYSEEPETSVWRRLEAWLLSLLPIERQL